VGTSKSRGGKRSLRVTVGTLVSHGFDVQAVKVPVKGSPWNEWTDPYDRANLRNSLPSCPSTAAPVVHKYMQDLGEPRVIHGGQEPLGLRLLTFDSPA